MLKDVLQREYLAQISENALICYYSFKRNEIIESGNDSGIKPYIILPENIQLNGALLEQLVLENIELKKANLNKARLSEIILTGAKLHGAKLNEAVLKKANLSSAILSRAKLVRANLESANLEAVNLTGAKLNYANLSGAILLNATIKQADLRSAIGQSVLLSENDIERFVAETGSRQTIEEVFQVRKLTRIKDDSEFIKTILPDLQVAARSAGLAEGVAPHELIGELVIKIMEPQILERLKASIDSPRDYLISTARSIASKMSTQQRRSGERFFGLDETGYAGGTLRIMDVLGYFNDPLVDLSAHEIWSIIERKLSKQLAEIMKAVYMDDLSIQEIAQRDKVPVTTIHFRLNKAFEILRRELREYYHFL